MRLRSIIENTEPTELDPQDWSDAEHAYVKYEVLSLPQGIVGYKFSSYLQPPAIGSLIRPNYVVAMKENSDVVDYSDVGCFAGDHLIKLAIPLLPGETTKEDILVDEWGSQSTYYAGNPVVQATSPNVSNGDEVLILVPTEVLDVYSTKNFEIYTNTKGERLRLIQ